LPAAIASQRERERSRERRQAGRKREKEKERLSRMRRGKKLEKVAYVDLVLEVFFVF
jgi:hypothetical protein